MRKKFISFLAPGLIAAATVASGCNLAWAQNCSGSPDALGTSRVLAINPREYPRVGAMDRAVALPLTDKEVVLTLRRASTALFKPNSRYSCRPMRKGDILPSRRNGSCASLNSAPNFR